MGRIDGRLPTCASRTPPSWRCTYGADLVIYGVTEYDDLTHQLRIQPEYFVAPESFGAHWR